MNKITILNDHLVKEKYFNFFWAGFFIYCGAYTYARITDSFFLVCEISQIIGVGLMVFNFIKLADYTTLRNNYFRFIFFTYILYQLVIIFRDFNHFGDYNFWKAFFMDTLTGGLPYFAPLVLLIFPKISLYKNLFNFIVIFGCLYIFYDLLFIKYLLSSDRGSVQSQGTIEMLANISFGCGFILLSYYYHPKKHLLVSVLVLFLSLLFAVLRARRGLIVMYSSIVFFSLFIFTIKSKHFILTIMVTIFILLSSILYLTSIYKIDDNKILGYLFERGTEDTRTMVEVYLYEDLDFNDWIFGKGLLGTYYAPDIDIGQKTNYRDVIETGYLQMILKGGLISVFLFFLISIPALFLGLFSSKNLLSKTAGIWIFMVIANSYLAIMHAFTLQYLLFWISIGICYSEEIRSLTDKELKDIFKPVNT